MTKRGYNIHPSRDTGMIYPPFAFRVAFLFVPSKSVFFLQYGIIEIFRALQTKVDWSYHTVQYSTVALSKYLYGYCTI